MGNDREIVEKLSKFSAPHFMEKNVGQTFLPVWDGI